MPRTTVHDQSKGIEFTRWLEGFTVLFYAYIHISLSGRKTH